MLQMKCLSSLEVARQRQSKRAKLHFGGASQPVQQAQHVPHTAVQHMGLVPKAMQQLPREVPVHLPLQEVKQNVTVNHIEPAPNAQQQARQKLKAIRDELGV